MRKILFQIIAAFSFFTRIPFWRFVDVPFVEYRKIICFWPLTGWLTGFITAISFVIFSTIFPTIISIILAFAVKLLLTGALHEDGLGDFFDGFGGGRTKADILRIMKDSQVGSFALIGMIFYYLLLINIVNSVESNLIPILIFVGDPMSKFMTTILMNLLPYARNENESKSKTIYDKLSLTRMIISAIFGLAPICIFMPYKLWLGIIIAFVAMFSMYLISKSKIGGYTGDICGATTLICELSFYLSTYGLISSF